MLTGLEIDPTVFLPPNITTLQNQQNDVEIRTSTILIIYVCIIEQEIFLQSYRGSFRRTDCGINSTATVEALSLEGSSGLGSNAVYNSLRDFTTVTPTNVNTLGHK